MKKLILFIFVFAYTLPSFAQVKTDGAGFKSAWGAGAIKISGLRDNDGVAGVACLGTSKASGLVQVDDNKRQGHMRQDLRRYFLDYNTQYYIAREINQNGAKFCKTVISGTRGGCHGNTHTTYHEPSGSSDCFWLCKQGFYGDACSSRVSSSATPSILPEQFIAKKAGDGVVPMGKNPRSSTNIEESIPMFEANRYVQCHNNNTGGHNDETGFVSFKDWASKKNQEHDIVLALRQIKKEDNKVNVNGTDVDAISFGVQPLAVRAGTPEMCEEIGNNISLPMVDFVGEPKVVCPSDYEWYEVFKFETLPADRTEQTLTPEEAAMVTNGKYGEYNVIESIVCIDPTAKARSEQDKVVQFNENLLKNLCSDFKREAYKPDLHDLYVVDSKSGVALAQDQQPNPGDTVVWSNKCAKYKCKSASLGFKSDWKVNGDMGCYECIGDTLRFGIDTEGTCLICDKGYIFDAKTSKQCEKAEAFTKNDMRYGKGKQPSVSLADQCWIHDNPTCYTCCMLNMDKTSDGCKDCDFGTETE